MAQKVRRWFKIELKKDGFNINAEDFLDLQHEYVLAVGATNPNFIPGPCIKDYFDRIVTPLGLLYAPKTIEVGIDMVTTDLVVKQ